MLWRSLWKIHVATVRRTKASLCNTSVSQNHPHPFSKRNHYCYCVGLRTGQHNETKQKRKPSQPARLCEMSPCIYCQTAGCLFLSESFHSHTEIFWTRLLINSTRFWVCYDGTYKTSVKMREGYWAKLGRNTSKKQCKAVNLSSEI